MNPLALATTLVLTMTSSSPALFAHGGQYRGPGDTVPPGGGGTGGAATGPAGPSNPTGSNPGTGGTGVTGPGGHGTPGGGTLGTSPGVGVDQDLSQWSFWWEFNKEPYLELKRAIHLDQPDTGSADWFLGHGEKEQSRDSLAPTEEQIRRDVVPALLEALREQEDNDILTGCMIALAKIGDAPRESGGSEFEPLLRGFLASKNQEVSETAAIALGILAQEESIDTLAALLEDADIARTWVGRSEVSYRTRAFAAYGLGLVGARIGNEPERRDVVAALHRSLRSDRSKTRDVKAACILALGMVPLEAEGQSTEAPATNAGAPRTRGEQLDFLLAFLQDESQDWLVRAHCPRSLARLCSSSLPVEQHAEYRQRIVEQLLASLSDKSRTPLLQSATLALGQLATNDLANPLDRRVMEALVALPKQVSDHQTRNFALVALAQIAARTAADAKDPENGQDLVTKTLLTQLSGGKSGLPSWAGLACGVLGHGLRDSQAAAQKIQGLQEAVRGALQEERSGERIGALAISLGMQRDAEAGELLLELLTRTKEEDAQGYVALALGLLGDRSALDPIRSVLSQAKYRPALLRQAAIALGLLGDKNAVPFLTEKLASAQGLASQAALASALGFIGDARSVDPLVAMLRNEGLTTKARGFAAAALGMVADPADLPWSTAIGLDLNYRASTSTLTDQGSGTGILDIL